MQDEYMALYLRAKGTKIVPSNGQLQPVRVVYEHWYMDHNRRCKSANPEGIDTAASGSGSY